MAAEGSSDATCRAFRVPGGQLVRLETDLPFEKIADICDPLGLNTQIMLATPELGGMPFVVSGLVAAGGLAAALSTADGLLLTISNALVHDIGPGRARKPKSAEGRVILSKFALLAVAMLAAVVAAFKPAEILALVSTSFSLAAAAFWTSTSKPLVRANSLNSGAEQHVQVPLTTC